MGSHLCSGTWRRGGHLSSGCVLFLASFLGSLLRPVFLPGRWLSLAPVVLTPVTSVQLLPGSQSFLHSKPHSPLPALDLLPILTPAARSCPLSRRPVDPLPFQNGLWAMPSLGHINSYSEGLCSPITLSSPILESCLHTGPQRCHNSRYSQFSEGSGRVLSVDLKNKVAVPVSPAPNLLGFGLEHCQT